MTDSSLRVGFFSRLIVNFALGDGSVRSIRTSIDGTTLGLLAHRSDGLAITNLD
jgi:hypothetical protein